jgi:hypothetical protein
MVNAQIPENRMKTVAALAVSLLVSTAATARIELERIKLSARIPDRGVRRRREERTLHGAGR